MEKSVSPYCLADSWAMTETRNTSDYAGYVSGASDPNIGFGLSLTQDTVMSPQACIFAGRIWAMVAAVP